MHGLKHIIKFLYKIHSKRYKKSWMLRHLIYCCIDFHFFFTVVNNNKKRHFGSNQILVCQEKKKREKEKIKKDTFSSTACMPCTIVCSLKPVVELERPKLPNHFYHGKSFVWWKVYCIHVQVLFQGCVLTLCFGLFILYYHTYKLHISHHLEMAW